jgi:cytochrome c-type biogenesis protein CcmH/NrfG
MNRANTLVGLSRMEEALGGYANAIALEPENAEAHFNAGSRGFAWAIFVKVGNNMNIAGKRSADSSSQRIIE